jgi:hypothetical protein
MTREEALALYRPIRASVRRILSAAFRVCNQPDLMRAAKQLGLWADGNIVLPEDAKPPRCLRTSRSSSRTSAGGGASLRGCRSAVSPAVAPWGRSAGSQRVVSQRPALLAEICLRSALCRSNTT